MKNLIIFCLGLFWIQNILNAQCIFPASVNGNKVVDIYVVLDKIYLDVENSDIDIILEDTTGNFKIVERGITHKNTGDYVFAKLACGSHIRMEEKTTVKRNAKNELVLAGFQIKQSGSLIVGGVGIAVVGTALGVGLSQDSFRHQGLMKICSFGHL